MIDPIAFSGFGLQIRWYGIYYALGFLISYYFVMHFAKDFKLRKEFVEDTFFYFMIASVLGGRLFYILFYNLGYYLSNPLKVFAVWEGGMSIHGGIAMGVLAIYICSKKEKVNPLKVTDLFSIPAALGLAFGRLLNFINQELVGTITSSKLGVVFPLVDGENRWPYQLFAGFKNLIVFNILLYVHFFKKYKTGTLTALFLILYSLGRFALDFLREPTVSLGLISMGQLLSLVYAAIGFYILYKVNKN